MLSDRTRSETRIFRLSGSSGWILPRGSYDAYSMFNAFVAFGSERQSAADIPYSFCALPGRYIGELCEQAAAHGTAGYALVLSPAVNLSADELQPLLAALEHDATGAPGADVTIIASRDGQVLAYLWQAAALAALRLDPGPAPDAPAALPWQVLPTSPRLYALRFLSGVDAPLDAALLRRMGWRVRLLRGGAGLAGPWHPALPSFPTTTLVARLIAERWLSASESGGAQAWALMPHHAGDVLLTADILRNAPCGVQGLIVNRQYAAIVSRIAPGLPLCVLDADPPTRGDFATPGHPLNDEARYLEEVVLPALPAHAVPVWLRPLRGYQEAETTVSAQIAFALSSAREMRHWPSVAPVPAAETAPIAVRAPHAALRVLLHLDGGWPLKVVSTGWMQDFLAGLAQRNWSASILSDRPIASSAPVHRFESLEALDRLLDAHDVLIGADSFPVHYANIHHHMPTICLFGPTSLRNLASARANYRAVSAGLSCSPCGARALCPAYGGEVCRNFASAADVLALLDGGCR